LGKKYGKKMEGKKIAGCLRMSINHFLPLDFFALLFRSDRTTNGNDEQE
jgi:hypothetical protein